jgi:adenylylsulfate kinase-like enzyme
MTIIADKGSNGVLANLLTKTCQNKDSQNPCKQAEEGEIFPMIEVANPYKLPLNPESTVFTEKPDESAINVIGYQYRFEDNR